MKTIKELCNYFIKNNIRIFSSKNPEITCISGKYAEMINNVNEIEYLNIEAWESFYNNRWTSFIKIAPEEFKNGQNSFNKYDLDSDYNDDYDHHPDSLKQMEMDAWEYDGDPALFEECGRPGY